MKTKGKDEKYSKILSKKMNTSSEELLQGLPIEFLTFLQNVRDLQFEQKPDYDYLRKLLRKMNNSGVLIEEIKLDYIDYIEKIKNKKINKNKIKEILNGGESKRPTKSNTNNDSHNNK